MTSPWADSTARVEKKGLEITLTIKAGAGYEVPWLVVRGSESDVAEFLRLDQDSDEYKASPFAAIQGQAIKGSRWAQDEYKSSGK